MASSIEKLSRIQALPASYVAQTRKEAVGTGGRMEKADSGHGFAARPLVLLEMA